MMFSRALQRGRCVARPAFSRGAPRRWLTHDRNWLPMTSGLRDSGAAFDAAQAGDLVRANDLQRRITRIFDLLFGGAEFPEGFRVGATVRGFRMGPSRQPATPDQHAARARLAERIGQALAAEGLETAL